MTKKNKFKNIMLEKDGFDPSPMMMTTLEENYSASLQVIETALRIYNLDDLPRDQDEETTERVLDDIDTVFSALNLYLVRQKPEDPTTT